MALGVGRSKKTIAITTTEIVAAFEGRTAITIVNDSDVDIYIAEGEDAVVNEGILLRSGGGVYDRKKEGPQAYIFTGAIDGIRAAAAGTKNVTISEQPKV